jgi:hypothetical protein
MLTFLYCRCFTDQLCCVVTLASVVEDARFGLSSPRMVWFGLLGHYARAQVAALLGCDFMLGGVPGVTARVVNQQIRHQLTTYINNLDDDIRAAVDIAIKGVLFMPVHNDQGMLIYSVAPPRSLPSFLRDFIVGAVRVDDLDIAKHPECLCGRVYYQHLSVGRWRECATCEPSRWLCGSCTRLHNCNDSDVNVAARVQQFDDGVDRALIRRTELPAVRGLPSEQLVPLEVHEQLVEFTAPPVMRDFLRSQVQ